MEYVELSIKELEKISKILAGKVKERYDPNLIIYIAKGGFLIAKSISDVLDVPFIGIYAMRKGNKSKDFLSPILSRMPRFLTNFLRKIELKSNIHRTITERDVFLFSNS